MMQRLLETPNTNDMLHWFCEQSDIKTDLHFRDSQHRTRHFCWLTVKTVLRLTWEFSCAQVGYAQTYIYIIPNYDVFRSKWEVYSMQFTCCTLDNEIRRFGSWVLCLQLTQLRNWGCTITLTPYNFVSWFTWWSCQNIGGMFRHDTATYSALTRELGHSQLIFK